MTKQEQEIITRTDASTLLSWYATYAREGKNPITNEEMRAIQYELLERMRADMVDGRKTDPDDLSADDDGKINEALLEGEAHVL